MNDNHDHRLYELRLRFEDNVVPHVRALLRTAVRVCRDRHTAEDLVQETILNAWKAFGNSHSVQNYKAWLFAIMLHQWSRDRRKQVCDSLTDADENVIVLSRRGPRQTTADDCVLLHEILAYIDSLPIDQRTVLMLAVVEEIPLKDVARILKIPIGTVFSRLGRARAALRSHTTNPMGKGLALVSGGRE